MNDNIETKIFRAAELSDDSQENTDIIRSWERQLENIRISEEFAKFPETQRLKDVSSSEIVRINKRLLFEKNLSVEERNTLILIREAHELYMRVLGTNPKKDLEILEAEVDSSLRGLRGS